MALKKKKAAKKKVAKKVAPKRKGIKKSRPKLKVKPKAKPKAKSKTTKSKTKSKSKPTIIKAKMGNVVGKITHYFPHVQAAVIKLTAPLSIGDKIKIKGHTTDFTQVISSMQIDRVDITTAKPGNEIGLLVNSRVRQHDVVSKV
jgi:putative protease